MVALYMDECVHGAITRGLLRRRIDVLTVQEDGRSAAPDPLVIDRATALVRVVFTNDPDLIGEAHRRQVQSIPFTGVLFAHQTTAVGICVRELEIVCTCSEPNEWVSMVQHIPL
jgi:predicted nuclease of predicted toxin-antitoxin system